MICIKTSNMHTDEFFMKEAYKQALKAKKEDEVPVGAIIVKDGQIIARAYNKKEKLNLPFAHAEMLAIKKACKRLHSWHLDGCIMYVTLEPCAMCAGTLIHCRMQKVIYACNSYQDGAIFSRLQLFNVKGFNHYPKTQYFEFPPCSKIISDYFKSKREK